MPDPNPGSLATRELPPKPSLERLKNEAKQRLGGLRARTPAAKLAEAQHLVAREYGFAHWRALKAVVDARAGAAQAAEPLPMLARAVLGDWIGELPARNRVALHLFAAEGGGLGASMDVNDFGFFDMPADDVALDDDRLSFVLLAPLAQGGVQQGLYEARFDAQQDRWIGNWTAHGIATPLDFVRGTYPAAPRFEGLDGFWDSRLETSDGLIRLIFRFKTDRHGTFAWLDSPDRNLLGRPAVSVSRQGRTVTVVMRTLKVTGELSDDGQWIEGRFLRGKVDLPLTLLRRPPGAAPPLPQRAPAIDLPPQLLAIFPGRYQVATGQIMEVSVEEGRLQVQWPGGQFRNADGRPGVQFPGGPKLDLLASAPAKFFWRILDATAEFEFDPGGRVAAMVIRQNGRETRAVRLA
jgi:hypothetical protein